MREIVAAIYTRPKAAQGHLKKSAFIEMQVKFDRIQLTKLTQPRDAMFLSSTILPTLPKKEMQEINPLPRARKHLFYF